jgi:hypothetical protein
MGLFGRKDWNIIAIIYERRDMFSVNGTRAKGKDTEKTRDGVKNHERVIHYLVLDQKGKVLEDGPGRNQHAIASETYDKLKKDLLRNHTVREVIGILEAGSTDRVAKQMIWSGYPLPPKNPD